MPNKLGSIWTYFFLFEILLPIVAEFFLKLKHNHPYWDLNARPPACEARTLPQDQLNK